MSDERWEYKVVPTPMTMLGSIKPEMITEALNKEGQLGWELVSVVVLGMQSYLFLKRRR